MSSACCWVRTRSGAARAARTPARSSRAPCSSAIASAYRQPFVYTLTGFKWIGRVPGLVYGYEEAIGYCTDPQAVPDKDGISALARLLRLAASLKADGRSIADRLDEIACHYGVY